MRRVLALALVAWLAGDRVEGQSIANGASPGRASYRPDGQWNDGPFYTASHWNPYAPHASPSNGLTTSDPTGLPYGAFARSDYSAFRPGRGALYSYDEGFSPYSGYAAWYRAEYGVVPTRAKVVAASTRFFRSAPRLPEIPTARPSPEISPVPTTTIPRRTGGAPAVRAMTAKVVQPGALPPAARSRGIAVYRSISSH